MIAEFGLFLIVLASAASLAAAAAVAWGVQRHEPYAAGLWRPVGRLAAAALAGSSACLWYAFLTDDFSVAYVADNSNTALEAVYKFAAFWGGHEGSMLLWVLFISLWAAAAGLSRTSGEGKERFMARMQAVMLAVTGLLGLFLLATSNPFARNLPLVPVEGRDLNPILQDVGMILHPPVLFMGYAGLSLAFAAASALLWTGRPCREAPQWMFRSAAATWIFLTAGNALGSWWAYTELGWGGWWFWDPVENASFIPWLAVSALLHALILARRRGQFKRLSLALALVSFATCLLGTFIVRSGLMQSVHAFASDPGRGAALLTVSVIILVPAFAAFALRAQACCREPEVVLSREELLTTAGVFLTTAACAAVLFGTVYPLFYELAAGRTLTVGAPYFNEFFAPMAIAAMLLISLVHVLRTKSVLINALTIAAAAAAAGVLLWLTNPREALLTGVAAFAIAWLLLTSAATLLPGGRRLAAAAMLAHIGIAVTAAGALGVSQYESEALVRMDAGSGKPVAGVVFVNRGFFPVNTRSYFGEAAHIDVLREGDESLICTLYPMRQTFVSSGMQMSAAGIRHGLLADYYVSMGNQLSANEWLVRLSVKPLASWIWAGALIAMAAGVVALFGGRRSKRRNQGAQRAQNAHGMHKEER